MAISTGDSQSGFRYSEIVRFINEEVLQNGGGPDFYSTFSTRPWYEIEDKLRSIVMNPQVPDTSKRAFAWSALALGVRAAERQRDDYARRVWRLQEQIEEQETSARIMASELQRLLRERDWLVWQCGRAQKDLQWTVGQREAMRRQLQLAEKRSQPVIPKPLAQRLWYDTQPLNVGQQSQVVVKVRQHSLGADSQRKKTPGVLYVPGLVGPQMPTGVTHSPGRYLAVGSKKKKALQCDKESQGQKNGPVKSHFINPSEQSWSRDRTSEKQQPQGQVPSLLKGKKVFESQQEEKPRLQEWVLGLSVV
uniref:Testis-expressed protein 13 A-D N-terminal domain-containing protein n=1 Tax=Pipistrellus kuhlii TaxID=59472 RepID=A0A7J7UM03_PIPKU|nr:hypothetical protein mPipKuh1_008786 [Pipistrellus kuhlii]